MSMTRLVVGALVVAVLAAGCFPILLDVNQQGQVLIPRKEGFFVYDVKSGKTTLLAKSSGKTSPAWGRWSPDGLTAFVAAVTSDDKTVLAVIDVKSGATKEVDRAGQVALAFWSADGKKISYSDVGMGGTGLKVIDVAGGKTSTVLEGGNATHAWLPDSASLVTVKPAESEEGDDGEKPSALLVVQLDGTIRKVADVRVESSSGLSLSPDGKSVLLVEEAGDDEGKRLVSIDLADGKRRVIDVQSKEVKLAVYSPDGKRLAVVFGSDDEKSSLAVVPAVGGQAVVLDERMMGTTGGFNGVPVYPTWVDNETVLYFKASAVYGVKGTSMQLMKRGLGEKESESLQMAIDNGVAAALK